MLIRTQVMLEEKQKRQAEELALLLNTSMSGAIRQVLNEGFNIQKKKASKKIESKSSAVKFIFSQAKKAVAGPGDSEYDKYAYGF